MRYGASKAERIAKEKISSLSVLLNAAAAAAIDSCYYRL